jgi:hypothetical protein
VGDPGGGIMKDPVIESHRRYNASYRRNLEIAEKVKALLVNEGVEVTVVDVTGNGLNIELKKVA